jgi:pimeloyl-ACP methyl ester carboxylesterase
MEEHALIEKDISLFYRTTGRGAPVMLVHGFAEDSSIWDELVPALEK